MTNNGHRPLGPDESWKTGQRVPWTGYWADQFGDVSWFIAGHTFPPCIDRKNECAFRVHIENPAAATA